MKVNQSLLVKASILLVLSLSFIHAQWGIPFGSGFGGFPGGQQPYGGFGGNPFSTGGQQPYGGLGGLGGLGSTGSPFSFDQPYSSPFGSNIGQNYPNYGGYGQNPYQNQNYPNYGGYGQNQPNNNNNNQNNMKLRFAGQVYGYNPFYYVANLVAVDLEYISHFATALTNTGYQGYNPFYDPINGMNMIGNQNQQQQQQKQNQPATATTTNPSSTTTTGGSSNTGGSSQADTQKANQEALALVFAKEAQIHVSHLVKQQDSYGPKGVGSVTTQLVDSADKLVTAANAKKWNDYQQEYNNLNSGLNKISYYGMQQNVPSYNQIPSSFQPPNWPNQNQQQQGAAGSDANSGNVKGSSFFPFLGNNGQFTMPQAPQAPTVPEIPQQFANMQQQVPKQFSFPDMPQMPQIPQMQQIPQVVNQQQQKTY